MMLPSVDHERYNDSLERCLAKGGFLDRFYELFIGRSPEIARLFARTDFRRQRAQLRLSLYTIAAASIGLGDSDQELEELAQRHRALGVAGWMYDAWLESLMEAVREWDDQFDLRVEGAWRRILKHGLGVMKAPASSSVAG